MSERLTELEIRALAGAFATSLSAVQLLERAGVDRLEQPSWAPAQSPLAFWVEVNNFLDSGGLPDGRRRILAAAAERYPANPVFAQARDFAAGFSAAGTAAGHGPAAAAGVPGGFSSPDGLPLPYTVLALDAVRFSAHGTLVQLAWRRGLREIVDEACGRTGIAADAIQLQDRGDGFLGVVAVSVPKATLAADFVRELRIALRAFNRTRNDTGRVRVRLALHHGDVIVDGTGFAGQPTIVAARLVDAPPVRQVLADAPSEDLALIVSDELYAATVAEQLRGLDPGEFREVTVEVPKFSGTAWVQVPAAGRGAETDRAAAERPAAAVTDDKPADAARWDFLVSAAEADENWGTWIAWELEQRGYRVHIETWDALPGQHDLRRLDDAIRYSERTLVVLSDNYLQAVEVQAEWHAAWQRDPDGMRRRLIPVRVAECKPDGLLRGIVAIDLVGLPREAAATELVEQVKRSLAGRYRPAGPPPFPGPNG
ncbi:MULTISPECIES: TIR domain-containing protein [unclassified Frankia]|uniref:TIR domain-containing protein n=3 Tax=Frankia TaxID=1854 RepID=UPI001EF590FA|nr:MULTISPECIES: TIR domain-containing protein [unclassified Frankia]